MFNVIIYALIPIFVILLLGYMAGKWKLVNSAHTSLLNIFVMNFALPASLFTATVKTPWSGITGKLPLIAVITLTMWVMYAVSYFIFTKFFRKTAQDSAIFSLTSALPNYAALGLPVLGSVFGDSSATMLSVAVSIAAGSVLLSPFCLLVLEREKSKSNGEAQRSTLTILPNLILNALKKPIIWAPVLGVILSALSFSAPPILLAAIKPLALAATATALFLTGLILSVRKFAINVPVLVSCAIKLIVQPILAWGILLAFGITGNVAVTAILMLAIPAGFFGVVFGDNYGVHSPEAEASLLLSSVICIITLPIFISLTSGM
ncbi:AEC family transporter [Xenorhabdus sp. IM139775]|uniref:AEC family transporter n=1 Tax=Xenorhabdus sp. IM139775 TaxID=3025876 RepID=UPI0023599466|nr:AEC family transporter [Xenorhabdus sp. IM139775]MDC9592753.1 AEC family transporter [Xenorhabdus sp. IM139775]